MNFIDTKSATDYGPHLNAVSWLLVSVSGLFLFTRLYLKHCQNRGLWWDDWILLASWIALLVSTVLVVYIISLGYGRKLIPLANGKYFGFPTRVLSSAQIIANLWGKTSFGVTLLRIPVRWMRACVWCILVTLTLTLTASVLFVWFDCSPFKPRQACIPVDVSIRYNIFSCAYSALVDVMFAFLPWKFLLEQQMSQREKIGLTVAMSMGVFAGATAAVKASTIPRVNIGDARGSIPVVALGATEAAICIMAASIPILRALTRNGIGVPAIQGYPTEYPTTMAESSVPSNDNSMWSRMAVTSRQSTMDPRSRKEADSSEMFDETLTAGTWGATGRKVDDDVKDSIELTNYSARPQSPVDFTRTNAV